MAPRPADSPTSSPPSSPRQATCQYCGASFPSRNRLYKQALEGLKREVGIIREIFKDSAPVVRTLVGRVLELRRLQLARRDGSARGGAAVSCAGAPPEQHAEADEDEAAEQQGLGAVHRRLIGGEPTYEAP